VKMSEREIQDLQLEDIGHPQRQSVQGGQKPSWFKTAQKPSAKLQLSPITPPAPTFLPHSKSPEAQRLYAVCLAISFFPGPPPGIPVA